MRSPCYLCVCIFVPTIIARQRFGKHVPSAKNTQAVIRIVRVLTLGYRSGGPGSIPGTTRKKKVVGLERGPLSLVSTTEELLDRNIAAPA
jgi:hypothetical protein